MKRIKGTKSIIVLIIAAISLGIFTLHLHMEKHSLMCYANDINDTYTKKLNILETQITSFEENLMEQKKLNYEEKLLRLLPYDEIMELTQKNWNYDLKIDDFMIKEEYIYPKNRDFIIRLTESWVEDSLIPEKVLELGAISGGDETERFYQHLTLKTNLLYTRNEIRLDNKNEVTYEFREVPHGSVISLALSSPLQARLGLKEKYFQIVVP